MTPFAFMFASYFIGAIPWGFLIARYGGGVDIRQAGSKNIGATNVWRTLGAKFGVAVLVLDALKGLLPTLYFREFVPAELHSHVAVGCGIAAVVGHMFPCWLGFRGGKGVATGLGVAVVLGPYALLAAVVVFALTLLTVRIVSLGSMLAAATFAVVQIGLLMPDPFASDVWSLSLFSLSIPLLIVIQHRGNMARLWRGEEPPLW
ncbi:MAG: glycerol-3-phosphate 1-O-acyltransferase PlsY [Planctomycetaceae bacterium]